MDMPHTGFKTPPLRLIDIAVFDLICAFFEYQSPPIAQKHLFLTRNHDIRTRYAQGEVMTDLGREYGISCQRVSQIVHHRRS